MGWDETCAETQLSWHQSCLQINVGLEVWEDCCSSGQQVGFFGFRWWLVFLVSFFFPP